MLQAGSLADQTECRRHFSQCANIIGVQVAANAAIDLDVEADYDSNDKSEEGVIKITEEDSNDDPEKEIDQTETPLLDKIEYTSLSITVSGIDADKSKETDIYQSETTESSETLKENVAVDRGSVNDSNDGLTSDQELSNDTLETVTPPSISTLKNNDIIQNLIDNITSSLDSGIDTDVSFDITIDGSTSLTDGKADKRIDISDQTSENIVDIIQDSIDSGKTKIPLAYNAQNSPGFEMQLPSLGFTVTLRNTTSDLNRVVIKEGPEFGITFPNFGFNITLDKDMTQCKVGTELYDDFAMVPSQDPCQICQCIVGKIECYKKACASSTNYQNCEPINAGSSNSCCPLYDCGNGAIADSGEVGSDILADDANLTGVTATINTPAFTSTISFESSINKDTTTEETNEDDLARNDPIIMDFDEAMEIITDIKFAIMDIFANKSAIFNEINQANSNGSSEELGADIEDTSQDKQKPVSETTDGKIDKSSTLVMETTIESSETLGRIDAISTPKSMIITSTFSSTDVSSTFVAKELTSSDDKFGREETSSIDDTSLPGLTEDTSSLGGFQDTSKIGNIDNAATFIAIIDATTLGRIDDTSALGSIDDTTLQSIDDITLQSIKDSTTFKSNGDTLSIGKGDYTSTIRSIEDTTTFGTLEENSSQPNRDSTTGDVLKSEEKDIIDEVDLPSFNIEQITVSKGTTVDLPVEPLSKTSLIIDGDTNLGTQPTETEDGATTKMPQIQIVGNQSEDPPRVDDNETKTIDTIEAILNKADSDDKIMFITPETSTDFTFVKIHATFPDNKEEINGFEIQTTTMKSENTRTQNKQKVDATVLQNANANILTTVQPTDRNNKNDVEMNNEPPVELIGNKDVRVFLNFTWKGDSFQIEEVFENDAFQGNITDTLMRVLNHGVGYVIIPEGELPEVNPDKTVEIVQTISLDYLDNIDIMTNIIGSETDLFHPNDADYISRINEKTKEMIHVIFDNMEEEILKTTTTMISATSEDRFIDTTTQSDDTADIPGSTEQNPFNGETVGTNEESNPITVDDAAAIDSQAITGPADKQVDEATNTNDIIQIGQKTADHTYFEIFVKHEILSDEQIKKAKSIIMNILRSAYGEDVKIEDSVLQLSSDTSIKQTLQIDNSVLTSDVVADNVSEQVIYEEIFDEIEHLINDSKAMNDEEMHAQNVPEGVVIVSIQSPFDIAGLKTLKNTIAESIGVKTELFLNASSGVLLAQLDRYNNSVFIDTKIGEKGQVNSNFFQNKISHENIDGEDDEDDAGPIGVAVNQLIKDFIKETAVIDSLSRSSLIEDNLTDRKNMENNIPTMQKDRNDGTESQNDVAHQIDNVSSGLPDTSSAINIDTGGGGGVEEKLTVQDTATTVRNVDNDDGSKAVSFSIEVTTIPTKISQFTSNNEFTSALNDETTVSNSSSEDKTTTLLSISNDETTTSSHVTSNNLLDDEGTVFKSKNKTISSIIESDETTFGSIIDAKTETTFDETTSSALSSSDETTASSESSTSKSSLDVKATTEESEIFISMLDQEPAQFKSSLDEKTTIWISGVGIETTAQPSEIDNVTISLNSALDSETVTSKSFMDKETPDSEFAVDGIEVTTSKSTVVIETATIFDSEDNETSTFKSISDKEFSTSEFVVDDKETGTSMSTLSTEITTLTSETKFYPSIDMETTSSITIEGETMSSTPSISIENETSKSAHDDKIGGPQSILLGKTTSKFPTDAEDATKTILFIENETTTSKSELDDRTDGPKSTLIGEIRSKFSTDAEYEITTSQFSTDYVSVGTPSTLETVETTFKFPIVVETTSFISIEDKTTTSVISLENDTNGPQSTFIGETTTKYPVDFVTMTSKFSLDSDTNGPQSMIIAETTSKLPVDFETTSSIYIESETTSNSIALKDEDTATSTDNETSASKEKFGIEGIQQIEVITSILEPIDSIKTISQVNKDIKTTSKEMIFATTENSSDTIESSEETSTTLIRTKEKNDIGLEETTPVVEVIRRTEDKTTQSETEITKSVTAEGEFTSFDDVLTTLASETEAETETTTLTNEETTKTGLLGDNEIITLKQSVVDINTRKQPENELTEIDIFSTSSATVEVFELTDSNKESIPESTTRETTVELPNVVSSGISEISNDDNEEKNIEILEDDIDYEQYDTNFVFETSNVTTTSSLAKSTTTAVPTTRKYTTKLTPQTTTESTSTTLRSLISTPKDFNIEKTTSMPPPSKESAKLTERIVQTLAKLFFKTLDLSIRIKSAIDENAVEQTVGSVLEIIPRNDDSNIDTNDFPSVPNLIKITPKDAVDFIDEDLVVDNKHPVIILIEDENKNLILNATDGTVLELDFSNLPTEPELRESIIYDKIRKLDIINIAILKPIQVSVRIRDKLEKFRLGFP